MKISRVNDFTVELESKRKTVVYANQNINLEKSALEEFQNFETIDGLKDLAFTPDFHKGSGTPVGTVALIDKVYPQVVGNDIGCVDKDTEFLSPKGWIKINKWKGEQVCQFDPDNNIANFVDPVAYVKQKCDKFWHFKTKYGINQVLSDEHRMLLYKFDDDYKFDKFTVFSANEMAVKHNSLKLGIRHKVKTSIPILHDKKVDLSDDEIRLFVACLADGSLYKHNRWSANFKKKRKITRFKTLLSKVDVEILSISKRKDITTFSFRWEKIHHKNMKILWDCSPEQLKVISSEINNWDGWQTGDVFNTRKKHEADFVHYLFACNGYRSVLRKDKRKDGTEYRVFRYSNDLVGFAGTPKTLAKRIKSKDGYKYCFRVPTGFFYIRRKGNIAATGNCGMRLDVTGLTHLEVTDKLKTDLREAFFGGKREVLVKNKFDILAGGLMGTGDNISGYSVSGSEIDVSAHCDGMLGNGNVDSVFDQYLSNVSERDNFLGTIGGGNHFVEIQQIDEIVDKEAAYQAGGLRPGMICVMCHSGSLDMGHLVHNYYKHKAIENWKGKHPDNKFFYLNESLNDRYIAAAYNAANFAFVNRFVMANMVAGILKTRLSHVYDAPHNLIWKQDDGHLHRKGACPAEMDEFVIIPGSMGTRSCLAMGLGFQGTHNSAPHGAGRVLNRNAARAEFSELNHLHVVTKIDLKNTRHDVAKEVAKNLAEEAPRSYKDIVEVVKTTEAAGIAKVVAWMKPLLTIKG